MNYPTPQFDIGEMVYWYDGPCDHIIIHRDKVELIRWNIHTCKFEYILNSSEYQDLFLEEKMIYSNLQEAAIALLNDAATPFDPLLQQKKQTFLESLETP